MINYHIHTKRCGHARGEMEEYIQVAKDLGLEEIGFSDHIYLYFRPEGERNPGMAMAEEELPHYVADVLKQRQLNPNFNIKLGLEADYWPGQEAVLKKILAQYPFDYVLGSVHYIDDWCFDDPETVHRYEELDVNQLYLKYFQLLGQSAAVRLFDSLAHPDLIKKFGYRYQGDLTKVYEETAKIIKENDVCLEVNTAGLRYPVEEIFPQPEFLEICCHYRVPVTLGSDAHAPEQVGAGLNEGIQLLREVGYKQVATFTNRQRQMVNLP